MQDRTKKSERIYADLYDLSKELLNVLQPSGGNSFGPDLMCVEELTNCQIVPMGLARFVDSLDPDLPKPNVTRKLTELGKNVRTLVTKIRGASLPELTCYIPESQTD